MKEPQTEEQKEYNKKFRQFRAKVKKSMKANRLRSGELLLEFWKSDKPKGVSLDKIGLNEKEIIGIVESEITNYKSSLPTQ